MTKFLSCVHHKLIHTTHAPLFGGSFAKETFAKETPDTSLRDTSQLLYAETRHHTTHAHFILTETHA